MSKKPPTNEDLDAMFAGIDDAQPSAPGTTSTTTSSGTSTKKPTPTSTEASVDDDDPLAELANLAAAPRVSASISRPQTPRTSTGPSSTRSKAEVTYTPTSTTASGRTSEEKPASVEQRVSQEAPREVPATAPVAEQSPASGGGGGWGGWGGWATNLASAAVKQAQGAVKEIQKSEEAQKWAEQVKGYGGGLQGLQGLRGLNIGNLSDLRDKALPTFTNILHTLAPPISQHERLQIHITHDISGYPSLDPLIYQTFSRVMSQVEGGDLLVIQRGSESTKRRMSDIGYSGSIGSSGWADGPWWRAEDRHRSLNAVKGLAEGTKLTRVSAKTYGDEFYAARGGFEEAAKQATVVLSEESPVRTSDIFLAIQAISHVTPVEYFQASSNDVEKSGEDKEVDDELVSFAVYLHDPIHSINFSTISQSFPQKWSDWLNAQSSSSETGDDTSGLPEEIAQIIETGGVDPREWIAEWLEEILSTAVGVVAQRYVARRMGVGEGGLGQGRRRELAVESNGGEAARAGII